MKAEKLMTPAPRVCPKTGTLNDAAQVMWELDCGMVPVVERVEGVDRLVGVVTDRDICMAAYTSGLSLKEICVERGMSTELRTCSPDASIDAAEQIMREAQIRRLPVVDAAGALVGILSLADVAREAQRARRRKGSGVTDAEVGATLGAISQPRAITP